MAIITSHCLECCKKLDSLREVALEHDPEDSGYIEAICDKCAVLHLKRCRSCRVYVEFLEQQIS